MHSISSEIDSILREEIELAQKDDLQVRSIVKSVLCTVTDTLTPKLFPCPPVACA